MSLIDASVKTARQEIGVSKHVPITHFNSPSVLETQNGSLISVIKLKGVPFDTEKTDILNNYKNTWHRALSSLSEQFSVVGTIHRKKQSCLLKGKFSNSLAKKIDAAYHEQFKNQSLYTNDLYLAVIYKGITTGKLGKATGWLNKVNKKYIKADRQQQRENNSKQLNEAVFQLTTSLSQFSPRVLGENDNDLGYSELLSYLSLFLNGGEALKFKHAQYHSPIDKTFEKTLEQKSLYPHGNLSQYVSAKRILMGECIQFQGATLGDTRFGAIVTIKRYGTESASVMLDPLLHLDCEFISTHSFLIESKVEADKRMARHSIKMRNANDPAISQINALSDARDDLASDQMVMGYHHNSVMILNDSLEALEQNIADTIKCYMNAGFVAVRETLGQEPAFWAQVPGNFNYIARSSMLSSQNFVDLFPLHNYRTGFYNKNHLGSALSLIETPSKTPLWFNLHSRGPHDNPSPGHATLIGGNGSGKTVAMCFFDAQLNRYSGRSFFFDRNRGAEIYIRASGGYYGILSPNFAETIQFNPLQLSDTPTNRKFCKDWLVQLVIKEDERDIPEDIVAGLGDCVDYGFDQLAQTHRTLSNITKILPISFPRWLRLKRWLRGDDSRPDGEYAYLFDNETDGLTMKTKMGFDMTHFLDNEPPMVLAAVCMYLFHRLESSLDGTLMSVFLDEAWQYLDNPYWQTKLKKWLPTLRKLNCHIVFATQSPKSVATSKISHTILDNCATNIYFANPQAKEEDYIKGFNLTSSEFACIKENESQSRLFLYKQGHESALAKLNLGHLNELLTIMSGTQANVDLMHFVRGEEGKSPEVWVPAFLKKVAEG